MTALIQFHDAIGPTANDGLLAGSSSPRQANVTWLSSSFSEAPAKVLQKDATASNTVWQDVTAAISDVSAQTTPCFNSDNDAYLIQFDDDDLIAGIDVMLQSGGVFAGTLVITARYRDSSGAVQSLTIAAPPDWSTAGFKTIAHDAIAASSIGQWPLPNDESGAMVRYVTYTFSGITSVTTPAQILWLRKRRAESASPRIMDVSSRFSGGETPTVPQSDIDRITHPGKAARTFMGFDAKVAKIYSRIWRSPTGVFPAKIIYMTSNGWADFPDANVVSLASRVNGISPMFTGGPQTTFNIGTFQDFIDVIIPPDDWAQTSFTTDAGATLNKYWVGWEFTADASQSSPALIASIWGQPVHGSTVQGVSPLIVRAAYSKLEVMADRSGSVDTTVLLSNVRSGKTETVALASGSRQAESAVSFANATGDEFFAQVLAGNDASGPMLGVIQIS